MPSLDISAPLTFASPLRSTFPSAVPLLVPTSFPSSRSFSFFILSNLGAAFVPTLTLLHLLSLSLFLSTPLPPFLSLCALLDAGISGTLPSLLDGVPRAPRALPFPSRPFFSLDARTDAATPPRTLFSSALRRPAVTTLDAFANSERSMCLLSLRCDASSRPPVRSPNTCVSAARPRAVDLAADNEPRTLRAKGLDGKEPTAVKASKKKRHGCRWTEQERDSEVKTTPLGLPRKGERKKSKKEQKKNKKMYSNMREAT